MPYNNAGSAKLVETANSMDASSIFSPRLKPWLSPLATMTKLDTASVGCVMIEFTCDCRAASIADLKHLSCPGATGGEGMSGASGGKGDAGGDGASGGGRSGGSVGGSEGGLLGGDIGLGGGVGGVGGAGLGGGHTVLAMPRPM